MLKHKVYIIEDEENNRDRLIYLLDKNFRDSLHIIGSAEGVLQAIEFLKVNHADILLLDIELSDGQVFDLLNTIDYRKYKLIFITGYSEHAIRAFKYAAVDYLLKPVNVEELKSAIKRIQEDSVQDNHALDDLLSRRQFAFNDYIVINSLNTIEKIPIDTISHLLAEGVYTHIHHDNRVTVTSKPIGVYEDVLPASLFNRCHKSHIVSRSYIKKINKGRGLLITLFNGQELPVAVRKKEEFLDWFNFSN